MARKDKARELPIYQKAELISQLVESLVASFPEEELYIQETKHYMIEDVTVILARIVAAEGGDIYRNRMQNLAIIRDHAMHLFVQVDSLRFHENYKDLEYAALIRSEIDAFRLLFIEWVESIDTSNHIWDYWGLCNPPGAAPPDGED